MATLASRAVPPAPVSTGAPAADAVLFKTWIAVVGACLGAFLAILNIQIVSSSLADIQGAIGAGADDGGWITTSYLVAEIIVIPMSGWLARVFSLRTYLLVNVTLFLVMSVVCAFTTNLGEMIVARAIQGFAGGVLIPLAFSLIMTRLPPSKRAIGLSIYSVSVICGPAIGPVLGGYCNAAFGWQSIFIVNLVPGAVMIAMLWVSLDREPRQPGLLAKGDWFGIAAMAVGLGSLQTVLEEGNKDDWFGSPFIVRMSALAATSLAAFVVIQLVRKEPLIHLRLLGRRNFGLATLANFVFGFSMYGWVYLVPVYLSRVQGLDALQIGQVVIWMGLPQFAFIPLIPMLVRRFDPRRLVLIGFVLFIAGSLLATRLSADFSGPQFLSANLVRALAQSLVTTPLSLIAVAGIERAYAGSASALFNMTRNLGGALGIALLQTLLTKRTQFHSEILTSHVSLFSGETQARIAQLAQRMMRFGQQDPDIARDQAMLAIGHSIHRQASLIAFGDTILFQSLLLGLALAAVLFFRKVASSGAGGGH